MPATAAPPKQMKRFRLLRGSHTAGKGDHRSVKRYSARDRATGSLRKDHITGEDRPDIIETDKDLDKIFGRDKFQRLHTALDDGLESQTIEQLKELADSEEIDLLKATKKDDIISLIRIALG